MKKNYFVRNCCRYGYLFVLALVLSYVLAEIIVEGNLIISGAVDTMLAGGAVRFEEFISLFLVLTVVGLLVAFAKSVIISCFSLKVQTRYKNQVAEKLYRLEYRYFDDNGSASVINKMNADIAAADMLLNESMPQICMDVVELVTYAVFIGQLNGSLLVVMLLCYPLVLWFTNYVAKKLTSLRKKFREKTDSINEVAQDSMAGILVLRAFGAERHFRKKLDEATEALIDNEQKRTRLSNTVIIIRRVLQWIPNIICAVYAYVLVTRGELSVGELMAFLIVLDRFVMAFIGIPFDIVDAKEHIVSVRRIEEILNEKDEFSGTEAAGTDADTAIAFRGVDFGYSQETKVLKNLSFAVPTGTSAAFVGESGGGKSTIFHILCGFYPVTDGSYQLYGRDIKEWDIAAAREKLALVSQNVFLFPTTIYENVRYGNQNASREEVVEACKNARIHDFIMGLPEGYETLVGERGILLSGGERQRISIARAFLKNAPILLLDEPTSAVDVETERLIQEAIDRLSVNRTSIVIAHRLSTVRNVDNIMVLHEGAVAESGTHDELMARDGVYAAMYGREVAPEDDLNQNEETEGGR